jgi:hypothetical protein
MENIIIEDAIRSPTFYYEGSMEQALKALSLLPIQEEKTLRHGYHSEQMNLQLNASIKPIFLELQKAILTR